MKNFIKNMYSNISQAAVAYWDLIVVLLLVWNIVYDKKITLDDITIHETENGNA